MKKIFVAISIILIISACQSKEGRKFYNFKKQHKEFLSSSLTDIRKLASEADKIETNFEKFLTEFPQSEYFKEISKLKNDFDDLTEEKFYEIISQKTDSLKIGRFKDYKSKFDKIDSIESEASFLELRFKNKVYEEKLQDILYALNKERRVLENEKGDYLDIVESYREKYSDKEADREIKIIKDFLINYKHTIKKSEMNKRIDDLYFLKMRLQSDYKIETISVLNDVLDTCQTIKSVIKTKIVLGKAENLIEKLEKSRTKVYRKELKDTEKQIKDTLQTVAVEFLNNEIHEFCKKIISTKRTEKETKEYSNKIIYTETYKFQSKCGFGCSKICETLINVTATISGDEKSGLSFDINTELVSDTKLE